MAPRKIINNPSQFPGVSSPKLWIPLQLCVCFLLGKLKRLPVHLRMLLLFLMRLYIKRTPLHPRGSDNRRTRVYARRLAQDELYEQQKELVLLGERVVLATLGFDLNVHHPYKPLVEAIKKFKVAQNALAQVGWNFVNDGLIILRAGVIFLTAKFLKVKLPSDGKKVWWQEFDVTPRQLEEVSIQMLELYEQNRAPQSQGSEV
ncbi:cyclin-T1-3-like isoform X3 [Mangifera indica]|uniref:cyclin-T1-3-like isoform X3 n=1 Tax=Mangifera indica TaxID=29780 RepID=UPI001CFBAAE1|nr:cyclin-T1-3-like isoform X3 [Mangifera indica]